MTAKSNIWKKDRGKLGLLQPLLGSWQATADSPMGSVTCTRTYTKVLDGKHIHLTAMWNFSDRTYEEWAILGIDEGQISVWSFTSDGKKSRGYLADGTDVHPEAIFFEAEMPAGLAK